MKCQGNKEFGQDLGESKIKNTLDGMVCPNKTIFTKKYRLVPVLLAKYARRDARRARCLLYSHVLPARHISLMQHQVAIQDGLL